MSNPTRNGKIARLPKALRDELNHRLQDGVPGKSLVAWLNSLPEVQTLVASEFAGHPLREQNLSQWKNGGYRDWLLQQEALEFAARLHEQATELTADETRPPLCDLLAVWLTARYTVATRDLAEAQGPDAWRQLRQMCADVVKLRRVDQHATRLQLERERQALNRERLDIERQRFQQEIQSLPSEKLLWQDWSDAEKIAWGKENFDKISAGPEGQAVECQRMDRIFQRETETRRSIDADKRAWVHRRRKDSRLEWTEEEKVAWARLPENYDLIHADEGYSVEEVALRYRVVLGRETPEDRALLAKRRAKKAAKEAEEDQEEEDAHPNADAGNDENTPTENPATDAPPTEVERCSAPG